MELLSSLETITSVVWPLDVLKAMETDEIINSDLIVCHNVIKYLDKAGNIKLMKFLAKCSFNNVLFEHDPECLNYSKTNLLQFPFNFYQFTRYGTVVLMTKQQFLNNLVNLNKLVIKCYNGVSMREYIMYQFHEQFINFIGNCDDQFTTCGNLQNYFKTCYGQTPVFILFLWTVPEKIYRRIRHQMPGCRIAVWTDDLHWFSDEAKKNNLFSFLNADHIIAHYQNFETFYNDRPSGTVYKSSDNDRSSGTNFGLNVADKLWYYPHVCSSHFLQKTVNGKAIPKIFMYGAVNSEHYPMRVWFYQKLKDSDKLVTLKHPDYHQKGYEKSLATAKELYKYRFCYTTGLFPKFEIAEPVGAEYYLVGKFFEIMGSGVLLLCDDKGVRKQLERLGFYRNRHYIHVDQTNLNSVLEWCFSLKNEQEIDEMRKRAHQLVVDKYSIKNKCYFVNDKIGNNI